MNEICGDNRFEIIAKAKAHLLDATNIDTSEDEMKVLDSFLLRCWQMGWLDRYDRKTESNSEKPNNCEPKICDTCRYYNSNIPCGSTPSACKEADKFAEEFVDGLKKLKPKVEPQTSPTISKMEQVGKPQANCGDFADRLAYERGVKHAWEVAQKVFNSTVTFYEAEDVAKQIDKDINVRSKDEQITSKLTDIENSAVLGCESTMSQPKSKLKDEPQTDVYDYKGNGKWERSE